MTPRKATKATKPAKTTKVTSTKSTPKHCGNMKTHGRHGSCGGTRDLNGAM